MTDKELKDLVASLAVSQKTTSDDIKELRRSQLQTDEQMKKTDKKLKSVGIQLGNISSNQGDVAEEFFINSLSSDLKVAGINYDELHKNMHKRDKNNEGEFDIVLINGKDIAIIETKYKAHSNDLDNLINKKHKIFKLLYPQYNNYIHHLGLASFHISDKLKNKALEHNVFVLQRKGELIESFLP